MDTKERLVQWAISMGYNSKLSDPLESICYPAVSVIWEQIIQNVKSRQNVESSNKNIIINRLKSRPLKKQHEFTYLLSETEYYQKWLKLQNDINLLKNYVHEKEDDLAKVTISNKTKYMLVEILKQRVKESRERAHLLIKNAQMFENEITFVEDTLRQAKNLTPIECEDNPDSLQITETLKKCSEKLEKLVSEVPQQNMLNTECGVSSTSFTTYQKTTKKLSARKHAFFSSHKKVQSTKSKIGTSKVAKSLYLEQKNKMDFAGMGTSKVVEPPHSENGKEKIELHWPDLKMEFENVSLSMEHKQKQREKSQGNKRESLGILSESCFNLADNFLADSNLPGSPMKNVSVKLTPEMSRRYVDLYSDAFFSMACNKTALENVYQNIYKDVSVTGDLRKLLYNYNRLAIWNCIQALCSNLRLTTRNVLINVDTSTSSKDKQNNGTDIAMLQHTHIKTEMLALKFKLYNSELQQKMERAKKRILNILLSHPLLRNKPSEVQQMFELQIREVRLETSIACIRREMNLSRKFEISNELQLIKNKISQLKQGMFKKLTIIDEHIEEAFKVINTISYTRDSTACSVRRLNTFISDMCWAIPLNDKSYSKEISNFSEFPLEYNRQFSFVKSKMFYRNMCRIGFSCFSDPDLNTLRMISALLESPFSPPETLVINILMAKVKLVAMESLENMSLEDNHEEYCGEEFKKQESYIDYALSRLNMILHLSSDSKVLQSVNRMKEVMDLWLEMPFKHCVSTKRLVNEKEYDFYENQFYKLYKLF